MSAREVAGRPLIPRLTIPAILLFSIAGATWSGARLQTMAAARPQGAQVLYLPSGKYLKLISLGYPQVLADAIYIWTIQYFSNYDTPDRFKFLEHVFTGVISELDPRYVDPYLVGSFIMSLEAHDNEMALRLLDKGIAANPDDWLLPFEAGFLCYDTMGDHARAARYFEKAMQVPAAPGVIRRLHAEMFNKMGNKRASLTYWREVFDGAESKDVRDIAWRHVHDLTIGVDLETLQGAIETFRQRTGAYPINLESLVKAGLITAIPVDPDGAVYGYDRRTGRPFSRSRFRLVQRAGP